MPIIIGIAGDSATGKSTFVELIKNNILKDKVLLLEGDDDHKWERQNEHWKKFTHLNPKANFLFRQALDIKKLKNWNIISRVRYNHVTGTFSKKKIVYPKKYIIINGLHVLYLPQMRKNLDFKIYMDADKNLKTFWKIKRDSSYRNQTINHILENITRRERDYIKYIFPQINYADIAILYFDNNIEEKIVYNKDYKPQISLKIIVNSEIDIDNFIKVLNQYEVKFKYNTLEDLNKKIMVFNYENLNNLKLPFDEIMKKILPNIHELKTNEIKSNNNIEGLVQVIFLYTLNKKGLI